MQEMLVLSGKDPKKYSTWFELDFSKYPLGTSSGFTDRGITFNRTAGTSTTVLNDGLPAMSFNGDGGLSGGKTPDQLLDNDWKITMRVKIKAGTTNPMLFVGRSIQASGTGTWIANMLGNGVLDWWYGGPRVNTGIAISRDVWHDIEYESLNNKLYIRVDGSTHLNAYTLPNMNNGTGYDLMIGASGDTAMYNSRCFMRSIKIETKRRS